MATAELPLRFGRRLPGRTVTHLRREPAPPPGLRAAAPLGPGEALDRLVVRSDGDGRVLDASCERELLPAPACPALARRHGSAGASADPIVAGAALHGLPGGPLTVELPARIALDARDGDGKLRLALPPGGRAELELSSTIDESRLAELDLGLAPPAAVVAGEVPALCARRSLTLVHAVRRPLADPVLEAVDVRAQAGRALVQLRGVVRCDRPTTGRIDLEASWTERADTGSGPLVEQERRRTIGAVAVEADAVALALTQHAGDLRHRRVRYRPVAATRFPEFFAEPGVRAGAEVEVSIPNRAVPPRPDVHSLEPIFRGLPGLRVHLNRGWLASGEGELLGVDVEATRCLPAERFGNAVRTDGPPGRRLAGHAVRFDARLGLWYADVLFDAGGAPWPLAELALVRWQPDSVAGCELSPLVYVDALELL
jgi:hypothetical protein